MLLSVSLVQAGVFNTSENSSSEMIIEDTIEEEEEEEEEESVHTVKNLSEKDYAQDGGDSKSVSSHAISKEVNSSFITESLSSLFFIGETSLFSPQFYLLYCCLKLDL